MTDRVLLEAHGPLSQSLIWKVERDAYQAQGVDGWRQGTVPHYVTTNPFIASAYASVMVGFLRDCSQMPDYDPSVPVHIIELGAGPGRFGYHFLTELLEQLERTRLAGMKFRYVMTDLAEANVNFCRDHPKLQPLVEEAVLDFARFDIEHDDRLQLLVSGDALEPATAANPGAIIANYVFDSVPQDCYRVEGERLVALLAAATSTQEEPDLADPHLLDRLDLSFVESEVDADWLGLSSTDLAVLDRYRERLGSTMLLWPSVTLGCLDRLRRLWGGRLLLLSGDKGFNREDDLLSRGQPDMVPHGTVFSLMVNFHAIGEWVTHEGGMALHPEQRHSSLNVSLCATSMTGDDLIETTAAYHAHIEAMSPDDFFRVALTPPAILTDVEQFLALLRLSRWDPEAFLRHLPGVAPDLVASSPTTKDELAWSARRVWDTYFSIGEPVDLAFHIGDLFYELGWNAEAIEFLEHSIELYGPAGETYFNIALCHLAGRDLAAATAFAEQAATYPESADRAKSLMMRISASRDRSTTSKRRPRSG